jgi:hypothetical protein
MRGTQAFEVNSIYPEPNVSTQLNGDYTVSDVAFFEPSTNAVQQRVTGTIRTSENSGYFIDIFRSARKDGNDKKHEYLFHSQGNPIVLKDFSGNVISTKETNELSSEKGDLKGYDYFKNKKEAKVEKDFIAQFQMPSLLGEILNVNFWMKGFENRKIFTLDAPYSRAINQESVPEELYHKSLPTLVVRQDGEARTKPFVAIIDAFNQSEGQSVQEVQYFYPEKGNPGFVGVHVQSKNERHEFIYNDENPNAENTFKSGSFKGSFGCYTIVGKEFKSILLDKGTLFDAGYFIIEIPERPGTVFIKSIKNGFEIDAKQSFKFTLPTLANENDKVTLETVNLKENTSFSGTVVTVGKMKVATFDLPELNWVKLKYK